MLRDVYADDNCWLFAVYLTNNLSEFLATGFTEMRREPLGVFLYVFFLPFRLLDNPYPVWHTVSLAIQVATPLILYRLLRDLCSDAWLAAFVASVLILVPLDHVVPYLSSINYRLGLLFGLSSLLLTDLAVRNSRWTWRLPLALLCTAFACYVFMEATIAFEAVRLLILWHRLRRKEQSVAELLRMATAWWGPFLLLCVPLVAYKLLFKPYGVYTGIYATGFSHFFDRGVLEEAYKPFVGWLWVIILRMLRSNAHWTTVLLGVFAGILVLAATLRVTQEIRTTAPARSTKFSLSMLVLFGFFILLPVVFIFFFAGRPPKLGTESTHATLMQPGYAALVGSIAYGAYRLALAFGRIGGFLASAVLATFAGLGVYFTNLNLDLFREASNQQQQFWQAFKQRFPTLPPRADFVIDAIPIPYNPWIGSYYELEDLQSSYELEFALNVLYPPPDGSRVRRYRVYPFVELRADVRSSGAALFAKGRKINRATHYGPDSLFPDEMTVVHYRDGRVLVNREILQHHPEIVYRPWADKDLPDWMKQR
jgi:hypothetical protein